MTCYIFLGPTLPQAEAQQWLDAVYLPPVSQGDIVSLLRHRPTMIGIIDGYFERVPAVWHKEILMAMKQDIPVFGGSSMGALRAAELHAFGMIGVGQVFEWYRDGVIEADDEVAIRHAPAAYNYRPVNEALVNIRRTLQEAVNHNIISPELQETLIKLAQQLPYRKRTYPNLLKTGQMAGVPVSKIEALRAFFANHAIDQKRLDAIALLKQMANFTPSSKPAFPNYDVYHTSKLAGLFDRDINLGVLDGTRLTADMILNHARLELTDFLAIRQRAAESIYWLNQAARQKILPTMAELQARIEVFQAELGLKNSADLQAWQQQNYLTTLEFEQLMVDLARLATIKEATLKDQTTSSINPNNSALLRQLRWENRLGPLVEVILAKEEMMAEMPPVEPTAVNRNLLPTFYFRHKQQPVPENLHHYMTELGFHHEEAFMLALLKYYHYHGRHHNV